MYFGIADFWVFLAYALCLASALICVVYGALKWNQNGDTITPEDVMWAREEDHISEEM